MVMTLAATENMATVGPSWYRSRKTSSMRRWMIWPINSDPENINQVRATGRQAGRPLGRRGGRGSERSSSANATSRATATDSWAAKTPSMPQPA
ncbi:hypothetical protein GCM10023162_16350 [Klenkia terrae]